MVAEGHREAEGRVENLKREHRNAEAATAWRQQRRDLWDFSNGERLGSCNAELQHNNGFKKIA